MNSSGLMWGMSKLSHHLQVIVYTKVVVKVISCKSAFRKTPIFLNTVANQYTQIDKVHPKITHFKQSFGCTFCLITVNLQ